MMALRVMPPKYLLCGSDDVEVCGRG